MTTKEIERAGWWEERISWSGFYKKYLKKAFPVHPTYFLGEIALFCFIILVITGIVLSFTYEPSVREVLVEGETYPAAYYSVLQADLQPFGLIVRQVHHWSANLMIAAILLHLFRIFISGAFKKPREINWLLGCGLLFISVFSAFSGYLLPYDEFAVTATGIGYGMFVSIPWIGPEVANFFFAGEFPALGMIPRFYGYHVMLVPLLLLAMIGIHLLIMVKQKHTEPIVNQGRSTPGTLLGIPLWPQQALLMIQLFLLMLGGLFLLSSIFPVHPIEVYGPPTIETPPVKPDWYLLWVYGLLKLIPGWMNYELLGAHINAEVIGGLILPAIIVLLIILVPFLDRKKKTGHYSEPIDISPVRAAIGMGAVALFFVLSAAGYEDVMNLPLDFFRITSVLVPVLAGLITYAGIKFIKRSPGKVAIEDA